MALTEERWLEIEGKAKNFDHYDPYPDMGDMCLELIDEIRRLRAALREIAEGWPTFSPDDLMMQMAEKARRTLDENNS